MGVGGAGAGGVITLLNSLKALERPGQQGLHHRCALGWG